MEFITKIEELYKKYPESRERLRDIIGEVDDILTNIKNNPPPSYDVDDLEKYISKIDLAILLGNLPAKEVLNEFGDNVLYWSWIEYPLELDFSSPENYENFTNQLIEITGKSKSRLRKLKNSVDALLNEKKATTLLALDKLIDYVMEYNFSKSFDLESHLKSCALPGVEISDKRCEDYSLIPLITKSVNYNGPVEGWWGKEIKRKMIEIYLDSPVGIGLTYKEIPNAVLGLMTTTPSTLMIYQLQGIRPYKIDKNGLAVNRTSSRGLFPIDWKKLMVECAEQVALDLDFDEIGIRSGRNNPWVDEKNDEGNLPLERALKIYDETAERLGYEQREDRNWYKKLD